MVVEVLMGWVFPPNWDKITNTLCDRCTARFSYNAHHERKYCSQDCRYNRKEEINDCSYYCNHCDGFNANTNGNEDLCDKCGHELVCDACKED